MEITDPATPRRLYNKPDQESSGGGSVDGRSSANSSSRSFDCTFCKRGFSNAQALGGHMNLHRKDKTRRNCTSPCPQFPFDHVAVAADGIACMSPSSRASKSLGEDEVQEKQGMGMPGVVDAELDLELRLGRR